MPQHNRFRSMHGGLVNGGGASARKHGPRPALRAAMMRRRTTFTLCAKFAVWCCFLMGWLLLIIQVLSVRRGAYQNRKHGHSLASDVDAPTHLEPSFDVFNEEQHEEAVELSLMVGSVAEISHGSQVLEKFAKPGELAPRTFHGDDDHDQYGDSVEAIEEVNIQASSRVFESDMASMQAADSSLDDEELDWENAVGDRSVHGFYDGRFVLLEKQISLPEKPIFQNHNVEKNFWPLHKILKRHGWNYATKAPGSKVSLYFSKGKIPSGLRKGKQMINSIGVSGCIGGSKALQLKCRERLAAKSGCPYSDLGIQPAQFSMESKEGCRAFFAKAKDEANSNIQWLLKPSSMFHGAGIQLFRGWRELWSRFEKCHKTMPVIMMEYISRPATIFGGYKFDLRTYLLVASLSPQLVFYHDGFVRKSDTVYDENDKRTRVHITNSVVQSKKNHFFNFTSLNQALQDELGFPPDYMDRAREYMKKVTMFMFHTARVQPQPLSNYPGRWHIFGVDWMIDAKGKIHLLEGNGYPLVSHYPGIGLTPAVWEDMVDLILRIHTAPEKLDREITVKSNFKFGGWSLVFNELEEMMAIKQGKPYNPCNIFPLDVFQGQGHGFERNEGTEAEDFVEEKSLDDLDEETLSQNVQEPQTTLIDTTESTTIGEEDELGLDFSEPTDRFVSAQESTIPAEYHDSMFDTIPLSTSRSSDHNENSRRHDADEILSSQLQIEIETS